MYMYIYVYMYIYIYTHIYKYMREMCGQRSSIAAGSKRRALVFQCELVVCSNLRMYRRVRFRSVHLSGTGVWRTASSAGPGQNLISGRVWPQTRYFTHRRKLWDLGPQDQVQTAKSRYKSWAISLCQRKYQFAGNLPIPESNTASSWRGDVTTELTDSVFRTWHVCSLWVVDTTKLAALLLILLDGFCRAGFDTTEWAAHTWGLAKRFI